MHILITAEISIFTTKICWFSGSFFTSDKNQVFFFHWFLWIVALALESLVLGWELGAQCLGIFYDFAVSWQHCKRKQKLWCFQSTSDLFASILTPFYSRFRPWWIFVWQESGGRKQLFKWKEKRWVMIRAASAVTQFFLFERLVSPLFPANFSCPTFLWNLAAVYRLNWMLCWSVGGLNGALDETIIGKHNVKPQSVFLLEKMLQFYWQWNMALEMIESAPDGLEIPVT